jgi:hypothetical protein
MIGFLVNGPVRFSKVASKGATYGAARRNGAGPSGLTQRLEPPVILANGEAIVTSTFAKQLIGGIERQFSPPAIPPNYPQAIETG